MAERSFADYVKDVMGALPTVNANPMLSATSTTDANARYREDPFYRSREIQARDQLILDEEERKRREAALSESGMMTSGGGGDGDGSGGRNYYVEREAQLRAANLPEDEVQSILRAEQEANNARIVAGLTLFGNAMVPGMGAIGVSKYGPTGYADYLQGNARVMMGDTSGYTSPTYTPKPTGVAAPVMTGAQVQAMEQQAAANAMTVSSSDGRGGYNDGGTGVGVGGGSVGAGGGNAAGGYSRGGW